MPNKKITALTALAAAPATNDLVPIVDVSDITDAATGTTKKITVANFFTTPTIGSFANATHNHTNAAGGGQLTDAALSTAVGIAKGGTGQTTATAAFDALAPTTTVGDMIYHNGSDNIRLAKGTATQVLKMNDTATAPEWGNPTAFFEQMIPMEGSTDAAWAGAASNQSGSILIILTSLTNELFRYERDANTGMYFLTHNVSITPTSNNAVTVLGNYVYVFWDNNTVIEGVRYDLADLTNATALTIDAIDTSSTNYAVGVWNDGTFIYLTQAKASTTTNKLAVSGTTLTISATSTTSGWDAANANMFDGTSVYIAKTFGTSTDCTFSKLTNVNGTTKTDTTKKITIWSDSAAGAIIVNIDAARMYIGRMEKTYDEAASVKGFIHLIPITKP